LPRYAGDYDEADGSWALKFLLSVVLLIPLAASEARIFYSKSFPGSVPAFVSIELAKDGSAIYKEAPDDPDAAEFNLSAEEAAEIFELAEKLGRFKHPLESNLKVANMGMKTFRWEGDGEKAEVKFNYSLDETARLLADWFEKITESQRLYFDLQRTVQFDRLGVNQTLLQLEKALDRHRLPAPERFLRLLDRVIKNDSYLNMARERAAYIAAQIRNPKPKAVPAQ
jgi:hypothetical protein